MQIIHPDLGVYIHSNHTEISAKVQLQLKFQGGEKKMHNRKHPFRLKKSSFKRCKSNISQLETESVLVKHSFSWTIKYHPDVLWNVAQSWSPPETFAFEF